MMVDQCVAVARLTEASERPWEERKEIRRLGVANGETWPGPSPQVKTNNMFF